MAFSTVVVCIWAPSLFFFDFSPIHFFFFSTQSWNSSSFGPHRNRAALFLAIKGHNEVLYSLYGQRIYLTRRRSNTVYKKIWRPVRARKKAAAIRRHFLGFLERKRRNGGRGGLWGLTKRKQIHPNKKRGKQCKLPIAEPNSGNKTDRWQKDVGGLRSREGNKPKLQTSCIPHVWEVLVLLNGG